MYFQTALNVARMDMISVKIAIDRERHASSPIHTGYTPTCVPIRIRHIQPWQQMVYAAEPVARLSSKALSIVSDCPVRDLIRDRSSCE